MYMPFLMAGYAATLVLLLLGCRGAAKAVPGLRGNRYLIGCLLCGLTGVVLMALRSLVPAWLSILLANQILFACPLLIYACAADILGRRMSFVPWGIALSAAAFPANAWFTWGHPSVLARILIGSGVWIVASTATAVLLFRYREDPGIAADPGLRLRGVVLAVAWLQTALVMLHTARCTLTLFHPPAQFVHLDLIQAAFTYLNMLLDVGCICGLMWLALCFHRRELHAQAHTDSLTGLLNRRAFELILTRELRRSVQGGEPLALLLLDIDRFKQVNDSRGHQAGDEVLRRVADALRSAVRRVDALSRYGGEEFVLLLRGVTLSEAGEVAERIRSGIAALSTLPDHLAVTVSIGVEASRASDTPVSLLARCDEALYRSKRGGRNLVTVSPSIANRPSVTIQLA